MDERDRQAAAERDQPLPEALAEHAATSQRVQGPDRLEARAEGIGERVEPDVDPSLDVPEQLVGDVEAGGEQHQADEDIAAPTGRHEQHDQEGAEEEEGGAEVVEADDDEHHDAEQRQHRQEVGQRRHRDGPDAQPRARQQRARLGQVGGDEDDQHDLEDLARLHADRAEVDP